MHWLGQSPQAPCLHHRYTEKCALPIQLMRLTTTGGINLSTLTSLPIGPGLHFSKELKEALVSIAPAVESTSLQFLRLGMTVGHWLGSEDTSEVLVLLAYLSLLQPCNSTNVGHAFSPLTHFYFITMLLKTIILTSWEHAIHKCLYLQELPHSSPLHTVLPAAKGHVPNLSGKYEKFKVFQYYILVSLKSRPIYCELWPSQSSLSRFQSLGMAIPTEI